MPEDFTYQAKMDKLQKMKVSEAAVEYISGRKEESVSTISTKNQITLPVQLLRQMGVGPGDRLGVTLEGGRLVLRPRPKDWVEHYAGSLRGQWHDHIGEIEAEIREGRETPERDAELERVWSGR